MNDTVSMLIYMVDYPQSKAEAVALSKYGHGLNAIFEVNEEQRSEDPEESFSEGKEADHTMNHPD